MSWRSIGFVRALGLAVALVAALASKQLAVIIPFLLVLFEFAFARAIPTGGMESRIRFHIPLFAVSAGYLLLRYFTLGGWGDLEAYDQQYSFAEYASIQGVIIWKYLWLSIFPFGLSMDHFIQPTLYSPLEETLGWLGVVSLLCAGLFMLRSDRRGLRASGAGVCFYLLAVLPTSSFFPTVDLMVERRVYLANFGLAVAWVGLVNVANEWQFRQRAGRLLVMAMSVLLVIAGGARSWWRNERFRSHRAIWEEVVEVYPASPRGLNNLANVFSEEGRIGESKALYEKLVELYPDKVSSLVNLASLYGDRTKPWFDLEKSLKLYKQALARSPRDVLVRYNMAWIYFQENQLDEAEALYKTVLELNPSFALAYSQLGFVSMARNRTRLAKDYFERALSIEPALTDAKKGWVESNRKEVNR
jgi:tetratricopeptide (TPR) repeat protein